MSHPRFYPREIKPPQYDDGQDVQQGDLCIVSGLFLLAGESERTPRDCYGLVLYLFKARQTSKFNCAKILLEDGRTRYTYDSAWPSDTFTLVQRQVD